MAEPVIRILETLVLKGPNFWSYRPCVWMRIDLGRYQERPSQKLPGFHDRLVGMIPSLEEHHCSEGARGGFLSRVREGTWLGHVAEHVAIEIQNLVGIPVSFGRTRETRSAGVYNLVYEMEEERVGVRAGKLALDVVEACAEDEVAVLDLQQRLDDLKRLRERWALGPSTKAIVDAAAGRGIPHLRLNDWSFVMLGSGVHQKRIQATIASTTAHLGVEAAGNKDLTKRLLQDHGVPVPRGYVARDEEDAVAIAEKLDWPVVVKPLDASHGRGVLTNIRGEHELRLAYRDARRHREDVIVEQFLEGSDFRFLVIAGRFICAAERVPAHVVGDGKQSLRELVGVENRDPRRGIGHEKILTRIEIDDLTLALLKRRGLTPDSVPAAGETVFLKSTANLSTGGTARDVTDVVHPSNVHVVERVARIMGLDIAGIDVISPTVEKPLDEVGGGVVEVNAAPGFRMHVAPSEGTPRDVAGAVVDMLFPSGAPARIPVVSVTGTNGKTTTAYLIDAALRAAGHRVGLLGTIQYRIADRLAEAVRTTPESSDLQALLREMADADCSHAVLEVSSHALALKRVHGCEFRIAVFTNLTRDHLDFHGDMQGYFAAKRLLFDTLLRADGHAVVNADDDRAAELARVSRGRVWSYSLVRPADFKAEGMKLSLKGTRFLAKSPAGSFEVVSPLLGRFNVQNLLAALGAALAAGVPPDVALKGFASVSGVPGRFERVEAGQDFAVIVDYAHTDDALKNLLETARELGARRVLTVFGCGGDRDRSKRPLMGAVASRLSDVVVLTSDNPRSEPPEAILDQIERGMNGGRKTEHHRIVDRRDAIAKALELAGPGDVVVIAGKGHETYQVLRDRTIPFDDRLVARDLLGRLAVRGRA